MKDVVIFYWNQEEPKVYHIPAEAAKDFPEVTLCQGFIWNIDTLPKDVEAAHIRLSDAICSKLEHCANQDDPVSTKWVEFLVPRDQAIETEGATIIMTGFYY